MSTPRVLITGTGAIGPGFFSVPEMTAYLMSGQIACAPITRFRTDECKSALAFQADLGRLDREDGAGQRRLPLIVRFARRALREGLASAGLDPGTGDPVWVFGTAVAAAWEMEACYGTLRRFTPDHGPRQEAQDAVSFARPAELTFGPYGGSDPVVVTTGCTSGLDALGVGWTRVLDGAGCAVVVAAEAPVSPMVLTSFDQITALTAERDDPLQASAPFSVKRSGFCIGEGAAAVVLESEEHAARRGARALAELRGYALTSSAYHMTAIHPSGEAIERSLREALDTARVDPSDVALLAPHATATQQNDLAEYAALRAVFGDLSGTPVFTGKAHFGHALGASNLIEVVATVQSLHRGTTPPHPLRRERTLEFDDLLLPDAPLPLGRPRIAVKNSSGFSGIHSAVVLEGLPCI